MKKSMLLAVLLGALIVSAIVYIFLLPKADNKIYTIGVINYSPAAEPALEGLKAGLRERGLVENRNLKFIYAGFIRDKARLENEARRLLSAKVDLIYAMSTPATLAAKKVTHQTGLPVVFGPVSSPVKAGIVESLSRPGGNVTGVTFGSQEPRRLEMLLKIAPAVKKLYVPYNPDDKSPRLGLQRLQTPAAKFGVRMHLEHVRSREELKSALKRFPADMDAIFVPTDSLMVSLTDILVEFSVAKKLPMSTPHRDGVANGALCSYGFSIRDVGQQAARLVAQVLGGTQPKNLPVELSEFVLTINRETASKIGLVIPEDLLRHAVTERELRE